MKKIKNLVAIALPILLLTTNAPVQAATSNKTVKTSPTTKKTVAAKTTKKSQNTKTTKKAATNIITTSSKTSYVFLNKDTNFVTINNKKIKSVAKKGSGYRIYYARYSGSIIYYGTKTKKWLPSSSTRGTVWYKEDNNNMMILSTNKKGALSYQLYNLVNVIALKTKRNSYVYNDQGQLNKGTVTVIKKGTRITGYEQKTINGTSFYITDQGWIKANNLIQVNTTNKNIKKPKKK